MNPPLWSNSVLPSKNSLSGFLVITLIAPKAPREPYSADDVPRLTIILEEFMTRIREMSPAAAVVDFLEGKAVHQECDRVMPETAHVKVHLSLLALLHYHAGDGLQRLVQGFLGAGLDVFSRKLGCGCRFFNVGDGAAL